jgi:putative transposase
MAHYPSQLTDAQILSEARQLLQTHLPLKADGYSCTSTDLYHALLGVAVERGTLETVCRDWLQISEAETVRGYLNEQLRVADLAQLENQLNAALAAHWPPWLTQRAQDVAIDFQDRPYYGKHPQTMGLWVRGPAKAGTTRFHRVATAYVIHQGLRLTVAFHFVLPADDTRTILQNLLQRVRTHALSLRCLYLDKGFAGQAVVSYLTEHAIPTIITCPIRGKQGGTRALCQGRKSYRTPYTFNAGQAEAYTATVAVCRVFTTTKRIQRLARRAEW